MNASIMRGVDETVVVGRRPLWCKLRPPELCVVLFKPKSVPNVYEFHYFWRLFSSGQWSFLLQKTVCSCCSSSPIHVNVDSRKTFVISGYTPVSEHPIPLSLISQLDCNSCPCNKSNPPPTHPHKINLECSALGLRILMWWAFIAKLFTSHNLSLLGLWLPITLFISKTNTNTYTLFRIRSKCFIIKDFSKGWFPPQCCIWVEFASATLIFLNNNGSSLFKCLQQNICL